MKLPSTILIQEESFHNAWTRAIRYVLREGMTMTIGDATEPKPIRDACVLFELTDSAIRQIENHELHPQFPFRHIDMYCKEFTRDYQEDYEKLPDNKKFSYTYFGRFVNYGNIDQLITMDYELHNTIRGGTSSNRNQIITWMPELDAVSDSPPCLQNVWIRYLGDREVEVHWHFRSRDGYGAFQANVIALIDMLNREVVHPNHCKIVKIIDYNDSFHIYMSDVAAAKEVKLVPSFRGIEQ